MGSECEPFAENLAAAAPHLRMPQALPIPSRFSASLRTLSFSLLSRWFSVIPLFVCVPYEADDGIQLYIEAS